MKLKLYIDFDGVILNTIEITYKRIRELYGEHASSLESSIFYRSIDWNKLLDECSPINDSIYYLNALVNSDLYDVSVLSHVLSSHESEAKLNYLNNNVPGINFIPVMQPLPKWSSVDCKGTVLVDDFSDNLESWQEHGGIPIKFSLKDKKYEFITIKSLEELISLYSSLSLKVKKMKKNGHV